MSLNYYPLPKIERERELCVTWDQKIDGVMINSMQNYFNKLKLEPSKTATKDKEINTDYRNNSVAWLPFDEENSWMYAYIGEIASLANSNYFGYDLDGAAEPMQYSEYKVGQHYKSWHIDRNPDSTLPRKLTIVVQLSHPDDYEGGDLEINGGDECHKVLDKEKGKVHMFNSQLQHRVTPITKGLRRSLQMWIGGPAFR